MDDKLKARLTKLKSLAERGVGGEKETAEKKLRKLLADNGLTESDLLEETPQYYLFSYTYPYKRKLLGQIIYKVMNKTEIYHSKGTRNKLGIYCTPSQKLEIDLDFEFYSNLLDTEIDLLLSAFIQKQDLFPDSSEAEVIRLEDLTPEEREKAKRVQSYQQTISKRTRTEMIEDKQGGNSE